MIRKNISQSRHVRQLKTAIGTAQFTGSLVLFAGLSRLTILATRARKGVQDASRRKDAPGQAMPLCQPPRRPCPS